MFLENMISFQEDFIKIGKELLNSNEIRYYNKYAFLEFLGQFEKDNINYEIEKFILEYCEDEVWGNVIINNVIKYNLGFYRIIRNNNKLEEWINSKNKRELALDLLINIASNYEEEDISLIKRYFLENEKDIQRVRTCFRFDISYDTDFFFDFRLEFLNKYDLNSIYIDFNECFKQNEIRTIKYLVKLLEKNNRNEYEKEIEVINSPNFKIENPVEVAKIILDSIPNNVDTDLDWEWIGATSFYNLKRFCIKLLKKANESIIKKDYKDFLEIYEKFIGKRYDLFNEIILKGFYEFPKSMSNYIIEYLSADLENRFFDKISDNINQLELVKKIIEKHCLYCLYCSDEIFKNFLNNILKFSYDSKKRLEHRIE